MLVAVAEMVMAGGAGATLSARPPRIAPHAFWFGEDQARYVAATAEPDALLRLAGEAGVPAMLIGTTGHDGLTLPDGVTISLSTAAGGPITGSSQPG